MDRSSLSSVRTIISDSEASEYCTNQDSLISSPGDILVTCRPFVHIITDSMKGKLCDLCLRPRNLRNLRYCGDCKQIHFCKSCLSSSAPSIFKTLHLLECPFLEKYGDILSSSSKFILRLYLRLTNAESIPYQPYSNPLTNEAITFDTLIGRIIFNSNSNKINGINDLCEQIKNVCDKYNLDNIKCENNNLRQKLISELQLNLDLPVEELSILQFINLLEEFRLCDDLSSFISDDSKIYELWTIFVRLWSYAVPIFDETITGLFSMNAIAYGLYLEPSAIIDGHSCIPNCAFAYYGPVIQLRAIQSIYSGQKLTVNYVDISSPKVERVNELRSYFISGCFCNRCTNSNADLINYVKFKSLKEEFVSLYSTDLITASSDRNFLNFSSTSINEDDLMTKYKDCLHISEIATELNTYYEQIYPGNHPDKSRFLFAYTAVEMNLLLFKLEIRNNNLNENQMANKMEKRESNSLGNDSNLDLLIVDINKWSSLLKLTLKNIRWTHGTDHKFFRQMTIPLSAAWQKGLKNLTLSELHSDPSVLLKILCDSSNTRQNSFIQNQFGNLVDHFKQLIPIISGKPTVTSNPAKVTRGKKIVKSDSGSFYKVVITILRALLILFAFLFPFFVYFVVYVEDF